MALLARGLLMSRRMRLHARQVEMTIMMLNLAAKRSAALEMCMLLLWLPSNGAR